VYSFTI